MARFAPDFQHDSAKRIASERVGGRPQCGVHIGRAYGHEQAWIEAEFGQPAHRQRARFNFREILPHPHQGPACRHPSCETRDESRRRGALGSLGEYLVHRPDRQAALQRRIGIRMSERHPAPHIRLTGRFDAFDTAAQSRKRVRARAGHAAAPSGDV